MSEGWLPGDLNSGAFAMGIFEAGFSGAGNLKTFNIISSASEISLE